MEEVKKKKILLLTGELKRKQDWGFLSHVRTEVGKLFIERT